MDPVNPWLDPSEVRHLAEQLLRPVAPARLSAADPGFNDSFVGFVKPDPPTSLDLCPDSKRNEPPTEERSLLSQQVREEEAPISDAATEPTPVEATPSFEPTGISPPPPPQARFLERIRIFRDWLAKNFSATDIFILDREGKVIFDESGHGRLHFMARNLALASRGSGNIHVKIGPSAILEVIPCETPYGRIVLGTLVPQPLPSDHLQTVVEVLRQTASPA